MDVLETSAGHDQQSSIDASTAYGHIEIWEMLLGAVSPGDVARVGVVLIWKEGASLGIRPHLLDQNSMRWTDGLLLGCIIGNRDTIWSVRKAEWNGVAGTKQSRGPLWYSEIRSQGRSCRVR
jgi:hypothetical protein